MGKASYDQILRDARDRFDAGKDFTVAVEEEFALVDPETLDLVNRFEDVQAAAAGTPLEPNLVGELIASEVEVKTGRCESFAAVPAALVERRAELCALVEPMGLTLAATGTHPWADWKEQRIIDTPHYRVNNDLLQYVVWRNNTFGLHVHIGIKGADRAVAVHDGMRHLLPELLAVSASSPFAEGVDTGLHSARSQIFTKFFPRCGVPDAYGDWETMDRYIRFVYETGSVTEPTQLWWSIRPHLHFPTIEVRIMDGQPDVSDTTAIAALTVSVAARVARAVDEGEPLPVLPPRLIEENMWRAIRYGLSGELIDYERGVSVPARERIEGLIDWVRPAAEEIGAAPYLAVPEQNAAERQYARRADGASHAEIYRELLVSPARVS